MSKEFASLRSFDFCPGKDPLTPVIVPGHKILTKLRDLIITIKPKIIATKLTKNLDKIAMPKALSLDKNPFFFTQGHLGRRKN